MAETSKTLCIVNKNYDDLYFIEHVINIYIAPVDSCIIKVATDGTTRGGILGRYRTEEETKVAYSMLINGIELGRTVFRMPSDEEVKIKINSIPAKKQRHITGKKTKGHGAS